MRLEAVDPEGHAPRDAEGLRALLDQLVDWGVLDRSQDGSRARTVAEYRRRSSVYHLTSLGYEAWRAVERVLAATPDQAELRRLALPTIHRALLALAKANVEGDGPAVAEQLQLVHDRLTDMAERARRFYLVVDELARSHEARPERFLEHKDRLLDHLSGFVSELQRHRPALAAAVRAVRETGVALLIERAAAAEGSAFTSPAERRAVLAEHWAGIERWLLAGPDGVSEAALLESHSLAAIADLAALLRRVVEAGSAGLGRRSALRQAASWVWACPEEAHAHALSSALLDLSRPRHLAVALADPEAEPPSRSWWSAEPAPVSATLRLHGKNPSPGRPQPVRSSPGTQRLAEERLAQRRAALEAARAGLLQRFPARQALDADQLRLLLSLLSGTLRQRSPTPGPDGLLARATLSGVRVSIYRDPKGSRIPSDAGSLALPAARVELEAM
mgnify:CR=1 FL=1